MDDSQVAWLVADSAIAVAEAIEELVGDGTGAAGDDVSLEVAPRRSRHETIRKRFAATRFAVGAMPDFPSGTVTFLFTDIEGSTALWERDRAAMQRAVQCHLAVLRAAIAAHGGVLFKVVGDAVQAAFHTAPQAVAAAVASQRALTGEDSGTVSPVRVRMALHAGEATPDERGDYLAASLNRLARLLSTGHGGQVLTSQAVQQLVRGALPQGVETRSLGEHRLRDLQEPEVVFQIAAPGLLDAFPPLRSLPSHPTNLATPPTRLIGREAELPGVLLLLEEGARLVTLTGPGGTGKTRLALEAAAEALASFPGGVWFLDLASVTDPTLLLDQIAGVLGIREYVDRGPLDQMANALAGRRTLLVLDNLEQFRPFDMLGRIVADVLGAAPELAILATSRAPLRLGLEREVPVPPLPLPTATETALEALSASPAVALFVTRAAAARPGFVLTPQTAPAVAELCRRLDGLPLAIELAAARVRALGPADILARLGERLDLLADRGPDRPGRQRTLEATIAWSHHLLAADEQAALRRLAVFAGFDLAAAESVLGSMNPTVPDALASLELLVEQSLVRTEEQPDGSLRYHMLETVRSFARARLRECGGGRRTRRAGRTPSILPPATRTRGSRCPNCRSSSGWRRTPAT
jgi:predicted ATPase/class 3 adenylate cyclase